MKEYFILQYRFINRKLTDFGLHPAVGYILILAGFTGLSVYLFHKTQFAEYVLILASAGLTSRLSEKRRNDFLKFWFSKRATIVRIVENLTLSAPFILLLACLQCYVSIAVLLLINTLMALANFKTSFNVTIPTPFYKKPFEFTVGFRNTFYLFAIAYCLVVIAASVNNFNLGIFSLLFVFFIIYSYYLKLENEYYVWVYALTPIQFLFEKIKTGITFSALIGTPIVLIVGCCFNENILPLLIFFALGFFYLIAVVLMKYSAYPDEANLLQGILLTLTVVCPPLLIVVIPIFFNQSVKQLSKHLK